MEETWRQELPKQQFISSPLFSNVFMYFITKCGE